MNRDRKLIILTVLYFAILGCFLLGCSEGTDSSPVSALMGSLNSNDSIDSSNTIRGTVLNSSGNLPMSNIYVQLYNINEQFVKGELTDSDGNYIFTNIQNGTYTVKISAEGYLLNTPTPAFCVANNGKTYPENYLLFLNPGTTGQGIKGTVSRSDKVSVANKIIYLYELNNQNSPVDTTTVLGDGSFCFNNVSLNANKSYIIKIDDTSYPISVNNGYITPSSINIVINKTNSITGYLLNYSDNTPLKNISVKLKKNNSTIKGILSDDNGKFTFTNLDNANYSIDVESDIYEITNLPITFKIENGEATPDTVVVLLKSANAPVDDNTIYATVNGVIKHSNNTLISSATATLYKKEYGKDPYPVDETAVVGDGSFRFFNVKANSNYYIEIKDEDYKDNNDTVIPVRYDIGIDGDGAVSPANISITINLDNTINYVSNLKLKVISAYTGAPLELATIKINNANIGATDIEGKLTVSEDTVIEGYNTIEITKEGFETLTCSKKLVDMEPNDEPILFTMIEDTKDGYGSITGRYVDIENEVGLEGRYVRLYRLIERTQNKATQTGNISETWYDVDKSYILTTKTSNGNEGLKGSFKLTHIEPGVYQIYISDSADIPSTEQRSQVYDDFKWTQIKGKGTYIVSQPLKVVSDQTTYWTNYEQGNNKEE